MPNRPSTSRGITPRPSNPRPTAHQRGYTTAWQKASRTFLQLNPLCYYCELLGRIVAAVHTDHYDPAEPGTPAFWDEANWRPACAYHNSGKRDTPGDQYVAALLASSEQPPG